LAVARRRVGAFFNSRRRDMAGRCRMDPPLQATDALNATALRGRRQGAAAPPAPLARDCVPWNPDSMHSYAKRLARMPTGRVEQAIHDPAIGITKACTQGLMVILASFAGGSGACAAPDGEREGQSPLAEREPSVRERGAGRAEPAPHDYNEAIDFDLALRFIL
jgi:hypothetical protein